ncbi:hypothetical protein NDU88_001062 [Pleurodeles waltl]|uniref:Uncharacterized protein n=1 Tax=Pleurodeles waltl TaxID=8319 RepID=A0AAV7LZZ3_PLEWA|nr:hypothetical protein NDU88_001062 [Pleurodeles waltl]
MPQGSPCEVLPRSPGETLLGSPMRCASGEQRMICLREAADDMTQGSPGEVLLQRPGETLLGSPGETLLGSPGEMLLGSHGDARQGSRR